MFCPVLTCVNNLNSLVLLIQDKVPRMCAYSASGGSDSDSDLHYGNNGFGAGRGKLVKAMKSATQGNFWEHLGIRGSSLSGKPLIDRKSTRLNSSH